MLLPNQWSLRPVGKQVELGDFPVNVAVHPGGRFAAVLHSGDSAHEILVVDIAAAEVVSRTARPRGLLWPGVLEGRAAALLQRRGG